jgi:RNA polymerase sigma-70 factor (ECF subfamily)
MESIERVAADPSAELMMRVQRGDAAAFEELLLLWQDRLVTLLWHQTGDHALAEDLAQEAFMRVYRGRGSYRPTARFSTWLYTIALNAAKDARERAHRRYERGIPTSVSASHSALALESLAVDASGRMPSRQVDRNELQAVVQRALVELSDNQRTAVLLSKFEQCSHEEIAETMGISVPAVKSLLFRARENLRVALEPYCNGDG